MEKKNYKSKKIEQKLAFRELGYYTNLIGESIWFMDMRKNRITVRCEPKERIWDKSSIESVDSLVARLQFEFVIKERRANDSRQ